MGRRDRRARGPIPAIRVLILTGAGRAFTRRAWTSRNGLSPTNWQRVPTTNDPGGVRCRGFFRAGDRRDQRPGRVDRWSWKSRWPCDLLVASTKARFADTHAQVGLLPGWGGLGGWLRTLDRIESPPRKLALSGPLPACRRGAPPGAWSTTSSRPEELLPKGRIDRRAQMAAAVPRNAARPTSALLRWTNRSCLWTKRWRSRRRVSVRQQCTGQRRIDLPRGGRPAMVARAQDSGAPPAEGGTLRSGGCALHGPRIGRKPLPTPLFDDAVAGPRCRRAPRRP